MLAIVLWTCPLTKQFLMQKETSTVKLWTHTQRQYKLWKIQPDKYIDTSIRQNITVFFQLRPRPLILLLSGWIFHRNITAATDLQTNFLPTSYWLARHVTSALNTKWLQQNVVSPPPPLHPPSLSEGKGKGREDGGWRKRKGTTEAGGGGRVNGGRELTHMWQDQAVLLMGREKYNNLKKRADRCGFHQTPLCHIYHTADRPDNSSALSLGFNSDEKMQWNHQK